MPPPPGRLPIGFAHRGASSQFRANTLEAFRRALEAGASGLESDAWVTADGVTVLDHDGTVGRWLRHVAISALLRRELPGHIPALQDLYEACGTDYDLSLDVKDPAAAALVVDLARRADRHALERVWLCSPDPQTLAGWRAFCGPAGLVLSTRARTLGEGAERARALGDLSEAGVDAVNLKGPEWSADRVAAVHRHSLLAFGWDAQSDTMLTQLLDLGVDAVYADDVARMVRVLRSRRPPEGGVRTE